MPSYPVTRSRSVKGPTLTATLEKRLSKKEPFKLHEKGRLETVGGTQITVSEGHPWRGSYPGHNVGGNFSTRRSEHGLLPGRFSSLSVDGLKRIDASILATLPSSGTQKSSLVLQKDQFPSDLDALGATAVALCNPVNPVANASTFLAEALKEGLPHLPGIQSWRSKVRELLGVPHEFLNAEFGWLPLVDEVHKFRDSVRHARDVIRQYKRDEGKLVRRSFYFDETTTSTQLSEDINRVPWLGPAESGAPYSWGDWGGIPKGTLTSHRKEKRRTWFKGAFRYYIPDQNDSWSSFMQHGSYADKLFGISLTPQILWELTPWSWAIDYFSNTQQVIQNLQSIEIYGLIMAYGYVMDENIVSHDYHWEQTNRGSGILSPSVPDVSYVSSRKCRNGANPFGFGLDFSDLSPEKMAILAAAGLTLVL